MIIQNKSSRAFSASKIFYTFSHSFIDIKDEINDDLRRQRDTIAQYQEFYEEYGSSNQENAVTELAEIAFASNYAKYDELKDKLDKIDKEIDSYVEKMDTIIEQGQAEKCACAQQKTVI